MLWGIAGLPGASKTLSVIDWVMKEFQEKQGRPIFYNRIEFLKDIGWKEFPDVTQWRQLPKGAVLVIDEAHYAFPQRAKGAPPEHVQELTEHRKYGIDIVFITQHWMNVDVFVRRLLGFFRVIERKSGMERARVYEFEKYTPVDDNPVFWAKTKKLAHKVYTYRFNKKLYGVYKSSEQHTVKRNLPWKKLLVLAATIGVVVGLAVYLVSLRNKVQHSPAAPHRLAAPVDGSIFPAAAAGGEKPKHVMTAAEYIAQSVPRVEGLPFTAPRYDDLTKPVEPPVPAACVIIRDGCTCYTQQATRLPNTPESLCRDIAKNGFFQDFEVRRPQREAVNRQPDPRTYVIAEARPATFRTSEDSGGAYASLSGETAEGGSALPVGTVGTVHHRRPALGVPAP